MSKKNKRMKHRERLVKFNRISLLIYAALLIAVILVDYLLLGAPIFATCAFVVLEAVLAICLKKLPIYIHALAIAIQIGLAVWTGHLLFVLLMVLVYVASIFLLAVWSRE